MNKYLFTILLLIVGCDPAFSQNAPDVLVNSESPQNVVLENQNFSNLYQAYTNIQNTVTAFIGSFVNGILQPASGGTGQNASAWTSGDAVYMASTGVFGHTPFPAGNIHGIQVFNSSGTFVAPAGITAVLISETAAGGGSSNTVGGASGMYIIDYPYTVVPGNSYTVTVGAGNSGTDGSSTTFDTITVLGGLAGSANPFGQLGTSNPPSTTNGGTSPWGKSGLSGSNGTGYGAGAGSDSGAGLTTGAPGLCIIQY